MWSPILSLQNTPSKKRCYSNIYKDIKDCVASMCDTLTLPLESELSMMVDKDLLGHKDAGSRLWYFVNICVTQDYLYKIVLIEENEILTYIET